MHRHSILAAVLIVLAVYLLARFTRRSGGCRHHSCCSHDKPPAGKENA